MSSGSLSDAITAIANAFTQPDISQPALIELKRTLSAYVIKHRNGDEDASAHLQEELKNIHREYVEPNPRKLGPFMSLLRVLRPSIVAADDVLEWFDLAVKPFTEQLAAKKVGIEDAQDFVVKAMLHGEEASDTREASQLSVQLLRKLLDAYLSKTKLPSEDTAGLSPQAVNHSAQQLQSMLVAFGRKRANDLYLAIDEHIVKANTRLQALNLLCASVEQQQSNVHLVSQTPVVEHLLKCLMNDTPTVVVSAALRCLIMLLPHIPASVAEHLPKLFLIYSRCLCWEKFSASSTKAQKDLVTDERVRRNSDSDEGEDIIEDPTWETLHSQPDQPESTAPELLLYFTYLYGLYPLNFMSYVRKPRKYLKNIDFPGAEDFILDQSVIRSRTEQFQRVHLLHPSFFNTTVEEELSDNRWLKAEPAEVTAECHGLFVGKQALPTSPVGPPGLPGPPPTSKLPALPSLPALPLLDNAPQSGQTRSRAASPAMTLDTTTSMTGLASWRHAQASAIAQGVLTDRESPTLPPTLAPTLPPISARAEPTGKADETGESRRGSTATSNTAFTHPEDSSRPDTGISARGSVSSSATGPHNDTVYLQREISTLRNELTFERYLKQQHLTAIGQLKRNNVKAITVEAETATLINANRALQKKLSDAHKFNEKMQKEAQARRSHTKQSEDQLTAKIRTLRTNLADQDALQNNLKKACDDCAALRELLVQSEARELDLRQAVEMQQDKINELERLRNDIETTRKQNKDHDDKLEDIQAEHEMLKLDLETLRKTLQQREREARSYKMQIRDLQTRLEIAETIDSAPVSSADLEQLLQDSQTKQQRIKRAYAQLLREYTELKIKYQELAIESGIGIDNVDAPVMPSTPPSGPPARPRRPSTAKQQMPYNFEQVESPFYGYAGQPTPPFAQPLRVGMGVSQSTRGYNTPSPLSRTEGTSVNSLDEIGHFSPSWSPGRSNSEIGLSMMSSGGGGVEPTASPRRLGRANSKSAFSVGSESDRRSSRAEKIETKSEVRVYGRGGAQNIKMKNKDEEKEKKMKRVEKSPRTNGMRGLKGLL